MNEIIQKIIEAGVLAPSGDNCQPWSFEVSGNKISIFILPERDTSLYSLENHPSLIATGAAIENMIITAKHFGYLADVELYQNSSQAPYLVAAITIAKDSSTEDKLYFSIESRHTNRKSYEKVPLTDEQEQELTSAAEFIGGRLILIKDSEHKKYLGKAVAQNERILFENSHMHDFFYNHINWTKEDAQNKSIGFYVKTLEVPKPALPMFKLARNSKIIRALNKFGFAKSIASQNSKIYQSAAAIGVILADNDSNEAFLKVGRIFERIWLTATSQGLSMQPLTGIMFLHHRIAAGKTSELSQKHIELVENSYQVIENIFGVQGKIIGMIFRVGRSLPPSARSNRLKPVIKWN